MNPCSCIQRIVVGFAVATWGGPRDVSARRCHLWSAILTVDNDKQRMFVHRVLFLHGIATRRGGKAATVRLAIQEWDLECDRMCFAMHVLKAMEKSTDGMGNPLFSKDILDKVGVRAVEGSLVYYLVSLKF